MFRGYSKDLGAEGVKELLLFTVAKLFKQSTEIERETLLEEKSEKLDLSKLDSHSKSSFGKKMFSLHWLQ